jgi:hypothetical protein
MSYISLSGYGFAVVLSAHIFLNRVLPLIVEGDSANIGLAYVSHGFARHGAVAWVAYAGIIGLGASHMVWGWAKWLGLAGKASWQVDERPTGNGAVDKKLRKKRRRYWLGIHAAAATSVALWAAGGLGIVARGGPAQGWVGKVYDGLYEKVWL